MIQEPIKSSFELICSIENLFLLADSQHTFCVNCWLNTPGATEAVLHTETKTNLDDWLAIEWEDWQTMDDPRQPISREWYD